MNTLLLRRALGACLFLLATLVFTASAAPAMAETDHHEHSDAEEARVEIGPNMAQQLGLVTHQVGPVSVVPSLPLLAKLQLDPRYFYTPSSRFAGLVTQLSIAQGDWVEAGQLLASIQALDGQRSYELRASQAGRVLEQRVFSGQVAQPDTPLLVVADDRRWQLQIPLFAQSPKPAVGQSLRLTLGDDQLTLKIASLAPANSNATQSAASWQALAYVQLTQAQASQLAPGQWLQLHLLQPEVELPLAVASKALQTLEGQEGVFVQEGDTYEFHPLQLGRRLGDQVEVLAGLEPGANYLLENAYLLKAELEKAGAEHEH